MSVVQVAMPASLVVPEGSAQLGILLGSVGGQVTVTERTGEPSGQVRWTWILRVGASLRMVKAILVILDAGVTVMGWGWTVRATGERGSRPWGLT